MKSVEREERTALHVHKSRKWFSLIPYGIILLIFIFLLRKIITNWSQCVAQGITFQFPLLFLSVVFLIVYLMLLALLWTLITKRVGLSLSFSKTVYYWFLSQLGKYVPGRIFFVMSRTYFYKKEGFRISLTTSAFLLETIAGLLSLTFVSISLVMHQVAKEVVYMIPIVLCAFFFFRPKVVERLVNLGNRFTGRPPITLSVGTKDWLILIILYGGNFLFFAGGAFYLFCNSLLSISQEKALFLIGALGLAGVIGMCAVFTPSGLGVREGSLFLLLCKIMPETEAALISVSSRLWMVITEFLVIGIVSIIYYIQKRRTRKEEIHDTQYGKE